MLKRMLFSLVLLAAVTASAADAVTIVGGKHELFSKTKDQFIPDGKPNLFAWRSETRNAAYYPASLNQEGQLTFYGKKVRSAYVIFTNDKLSSITFTLYNKKDDMAVPVDKFQGEMKNIYGLLKKRYPGVKPRFLKAKRGNALVWIAGQYACIMKWSISDFGNTKQPEYLQIEFVTVFPGQNPLKNANRPTVYMVGKGDSGTQHKTEQEENGDVFLKGFPMYVQPANGNSAAAVVQRILEYKGRKPAKPVEATPLKKGVKLNSDVEGLILQLDEICKKNNLRLKTEILLFYRDRSLRKLENLVGRYNRLVRKGKKNKLTAPKSGTAPVAATIKKMEPEAYMKLRKEEHGGQVFEGSIIQNIMAGQPMIWYVILGVAKEDKVPKGAPFLHMRVIIGFNASTRTVIYTDCWGKGHEIKRMSFDQAWAITLGTFTITPKD